MSGISQLDKPLAQFLPLYIINQNLVFSCCFIASFHQNSAKKYLTPGDFTPPKSE
jgi:hypothetical protein